MENDYIVKLSDSGLDIVVSGAVQSDDRSGAIAADASQVSIRSSEFQPCWRGQSQSIAAHLIAAASL